MKDFWVVSGLVSAAFMAVINTSFSVLAASIPLGPATGNDDAGNPNKTTVVTEKVGFGTPGMVGFEFENQTTRPLTDVHLRRPQYKSGNSWVDVEFDTDFENGGIYTNEVDGGEGSKMTAVPPGSSVQVSASTHGDGGGGGTLGIGKSLQVSIKMKAPGGGHLPADTEVRFQVIGTRSSSPQAPTGIWVSATGVNTIGDGAPPTEVLSPGIPDYVTGTVDTGSAESVTLNDIPLAERDGYRFNSGNLVIRPESGARFALDEENTQVLVYDEHGDIAGGNVVEVSSLRINDPGHLVLEVTRVKTDENHVVIVIRGLILEGYDQLESGSSIFATGYGAVVPAGGILPNNWHIAVKGAS